jgi:hypothetical protein
MYVYRIRDTNEIKPSGNYLQCLCYCTFSLLKIVLHILIFTYTRLRGSINRLNEMNSNIYFSLEFCMCLN